MKYNISEIIQIFVKNHPDMYKAMQVEHGYNGEDVNPHHIEGSVWTHTCMVMKEAQDSNIVQKLAALCHDIGKGYVWEDIDEHRRRRFTSHEAVSTFYAKEVLESFDITEEQKERVLKIVSQHGSLYNFFEDGRIPKKNHIKIAERYSYDDFADLQRFYKFDHDGRFYCNEKSKNDQGIYQDFKDILDIIDIKESVRSAQMIQKMNLPSLTLLIGPPKVGKSTFVRDHRIDKVATIISRDAYVESEGTGNTYQDKFKSLNAEQQKAIDALIQKDFHEAINKNESIVIDMTNMSKKTRKKWLSDSKIKKNYETQGIVFIESKSCLLSRNSPAKMIPEFVIDSMMKRFVFPNYEEFDKITIR